MLYKWVRVLALGVVALSSMAVSLSAQQSGQGLQRALEEKLAAAKRLKCTFPLEATMTWKDGNPEGELKPATLTLQFQDINTDESSARMLGPFGILDMIVRSVGGSLHFIQTLQAGALYTTTVFPKESRPGTGVLKAVHSRHEYTEVILPGFTSRPEQYYGECEVVP
jgi:hypothetical protein